ncbi:hypothetical protein ACOSQ2_014882 [Xanthoceras sorbifolium]
MNQEFYASFYIYIYIYIYICHQQLQKISHLLLLLLLLLFHLSKFLFLIIIIIMMAVSELQGRSIHEGQISMKNMIELVSADTGLVMEAWFHQ